MVSKAVGKYSKASPYKARLVANMIKGKDVDVAVATLAFCPKKVAKMIKKILESAIANAEQNEETEGKRLFVKNAKVDGASMVKRFKPKAMGRAVQIRHRMSHITIELDSK